ncbi:MAG: exported protein of unknown function, partial [Promethearchaeota archaeon]
MNKRKSYNRKQLIALFLCFSFAFMSFLSIISINDNHEDGDSTISTSDVYQYGSEYAVSKWWDTRFRFRIGFEVENPFSYDRYEPVDVYFTFQDEEHYEGSARLVGFNASGNEEWSDPIPIQFWNVSYYGATSFIQSATIKFIANVSQNSNSTYFLYFNENDDDIGSPSYSTDFTSTLAAGKLTVTVGNLGEKYKAVLEEGKGVTDFVKDTVNFHTDDSFSPEKQLTLSELSLLAHMDENTSISVSDSSGNWGDGSFVNNPTWTDGIVKSGLEFESSNSEGVTFGAIMEGPGQPFSDTSTQFTVTAWIYPNDISNTA